MTDGAPNKRKVHEHIKPPDSVPRRVAKEAVRKAIEGQTKEPFADLPPEQREKYKRYMQAADEFNEQKSGNETMTKKNETQEHAKLSASASHRWLNCPGSIQAEEGYENTTSEHAEEGTAAHELAEMTLFHGNKPSSFWVGQVAQNKIVFSEEMANHVQEYVDYVKSHIKEGSDAMFEKRVDYSPWTAPGQFGTADAIIINEPNIVIVDLKYGKGNKVFVEDNSQACLYALGVIEDLGMIYDLQNVKLVIHQPRLDHVDEEEISVDALLEWGEKVAKPGAKKALAKNPKRVAGDMQCKWCKAKADCPELAKLALETSAKEFEESVFQVKDVEKLSIETKAEIYQRRDLIAGFLDAVAISLHEEIKHGGTVPGFKLVEGRSIRVWKNEEEVEKLLNACEDLKPEDIYTKKMNGPSPIEKILGKDHEIIVNNVTKPEGKPTLVPESDKRQALVFDPSSEFEGIE